jgi:hypothetical protein
MSRARYACADLKAGDEIRFWDRAALQSKVGVVSHHCQPDVDDVGIATEPRVWVIRADGSGGYVYGHDIMEVKR